MKHRLPILFVVLGFSVSWFAGLSSARIDPMRIMTIQNPKPNVLFVITRTTAMAGDTHGHGNTDPPFGCTFTFPPDCHVGGCGKDQICLDDGTCYGSKSDCHTGKKCKNGKVCCDDGTCGTSCGGAQDCHLTGCAAGEICLPDGSCLPNTPPDCHITGCPAGEVCQIDGTCQPDCNSAGCPPGTTCETDSGLCVDSDCPVTGGSCEFAFRPTMDSPGVWAFLDHCTGCDPFSYPSVNDKNYPDAATIDCLLACHGPAGAGGDCHVGKGCKGNEECCPDGTCKKKNKKNDQCNGIPSDCHLIGCSGGLTCLPDGTCGTPTSDYYTDLLNCYQSGGGSTCYNTAFDDFQTCVDQCWQNFTASGGWGSGTTDLFEAGAEYSGGNTHRHKEGEIGGAHMKLWRPGCWIPFGGTNGGKGSLCWPSRMMMTKWVLGDSVSIVPPDEFVTMDPNGIFNDGDEHALRIRSHVADEHGPNPPGCDPVPTPFGDIGCEDIPPLGLINNYYDKINLGLATFSSNTGSPIAPECSQGKNIGPYTNLLVRVNPSDADVNDLSDCDTPAKLADCANGVTTCSQVCNALAFNWWMRPAREGGLNAGGRTPLGQALKASHDYLMNQTGVPLDDPILECRRKFVVLLTHGEHNFPSPDSDNPVDIAKNYYAPDINSNPNGAVRALIVGLMDWKFYTREAMEINKAACWAGTMADRADGGTDLLPIPGADPEPPYGQITVDDYPEHDCLNGWNSDGTHGTDHHQHAYFAQTATELAVAFDRVLGAVSLKGDFTVSAPVAASASASGGALLLSSTRVPGWKGDLRRWDLVKADGGANHVAPDVTTLCADLTSNTKVVSTGNPNDLHFHLIWDANCSLEQQYTDHATDVDRGRNIYTVDSRCTVGTGTALGPYCGTSKKLELTAATASWLRTHMLNVNWSLYDFDGDGIPADSDNDDILKVVDFILGGDGNGTMREWLLGDIINASPVVIGKPVEYSLTENIPPKGAFDATFAVRPKMVYLPANDGLLHAFRFDHNPRKAVTPDIESFAFLPPAVFPKVIKLFENYLADPLGSPTGQPKPPSFDDHLWLLSAPPSFADVWQRSASNWRTMLYLPLGPTNNGIYGLDVTDPLLSPPFKVFWYWNGEGLGPTLPREVWNALPIALSFGGGKDANGDYLNWMVGFPTTSSDDSADVDHAGVLVHADNGAPMTDIASAAVQTYSPAGSALVPYHTYGNMAFIGFDVPIYMPDSPVHDAFVVDTHGRLWALKTGTQGNPNGWGPNTPNPLLDLGGDNPIHYTPAIAHAMSTELIAATATGSIFETDEDINGLSSSFRSKIMLDIFERDNTNPPNLSQPDPAQQHLELTVEGTFPLDTDGDNIADSNVTLSPLTRPSGRPLLITFGKGQSGTAHFLLFDPQKINPSLGVCTGVTYLFPWNFTLQSSGTGVTYQSTSQGPLFELGYGAVTGLAAGVGKIITATTGYGEEGIALPKLTPKDNPVSNSQIPRLRSMKKLQ